MNKLKEGYPIFPKNSSIGGWDKYEKETIYDPIRKKVSWIIDKLDYTGDESDLRKLLHKYFLPQSRKSSIWDERLAEFDLTREDVSKVNYDYSVWQAKQKDKIEESNMNKLFEEVYKKSLKEEIEICDSCGDPTSDNYSQDEGKVLCHDCAVEEDYENDPGWISCELCGQDFDSTEEGEECGHIPDSKYWLCDECYNDEDNWCPECNGIIGLEVENEDGECSGCGCPLE